MRASEIMATVNLARAISASTKAFAKAIWRRTGAYSIAASRAGSVVLSFHRVKPYDDCVLDQRLGSITPHCFQQIIKILLDLKYRFVSLDEFRELATNTANVACITFDDGLRDLVDYALPVLQAHRVTAAVFLITGTACRKDLLWQHRLYEAMQRLTLAKSRELMPAFSSVPDKNTLASDLLRKMNRLELIETASKLGRAAELSNRDEALLAKKLYLYESDICQLEKSGIMICGHSH